MKDYVHVDEEGALTLDVSLLSRDQAAALSEVTIDGQSVKFKLHGKISALVNIGKHLGMFSDKVNRIHQRPGGGPVRTINQDMTEKEAADEYARLILNDD